MPFCRRSNDSDVTLAPWRVKSPTIELFIQRFLQVDTIENVKAPHYRPFVNGNPSVTGGFPSQRACIIFAGNVFMSSRHYCFMSTRHHVLTLLKLSFWQCWVLRTGTVLRQSQITTPSPYEGCWKWDSISQKIWTQFGIALFCCGCRRYHSRFRQVYSGDPL